MDSRFVCCLYCSQQRGCKVTLVAFFFFNFSALCVFKCLPCMITIYCICATFLHYVFSNAFSNCLPEEMHSHTGSIHQICLCCVFSNVFQNGLCVFEGFLKTLPNQDAKSKWLHLFDFSPVYVFNCVPKGCKVTLFVFVSFSEKSGFQVLAGTEQSTMKGTQ